MDTQRLAIALAAAALFAFSHTAARAETLETRCQSSKLTAWAERRACEDRAAARIATGGTADPTACLTKFSSALAKAGTACRYLSMEAGTVTDLNTGLMWQRTDDDGGMTDKDAGFTWSATGTAPDGFAFTAFLAELNDCVSTDGSVPTGGYAGHCDWRLPQIDELSAIVDCTFGNPCIDQSAFGPTSASTVNWSATSIPGLPNEAWTVFLSAGGVFYINKGPFYVQARAVRSSL